MVSVLPIVLKFFQRTWKSGINVCCLADGAGVLGGAGWNLEMRVKGWLSSVHGLHTQGRGGARLRTGPAMRRADFVEWLLGQVAHYCGQEALTIDFCGEWGGRAAMAADRRGNSRPGGTSWGLGPRTDTAW